jgi:transcriptional regulator with XRE-family HTH domain
MCCRHATRSVRKLSDADLIVANRLREARVVANLTFKQLGAIVGVSQSAIHKYEIGEDTVPAGMLWSLSSALGVSISWFFEQPSASNESNSSDGKAGRDSVRSANTPARSSTRRIWRC